MYHFFYQDSITNLGQASNYQLRRNILYFEVSATQSNITDITNQNCRPLFYRKRYDKAEKEFVAAKLNLHKKQDRKELLTEHLATIIEDSEVRKAGKLNDLMSQLQL